MNENWKAVVGYETLYEVSDLGRVRRVAKYNNSSDRPLALVSRGPGYLGVCLSKQNVRKNLLVHRVVAQAFLGVRQEPVNHKNGIKTDNRAANLEASTYSENERHKWAVLKTGVRNRAKLTYEQAVEIRRLYPEVKSLRTLAAQFNVSLRTIQQIVKYRTWVTKYTGARSTVTASSA